MAGLARRLRYCAAYLTEYACFQDHAYAKRMAELAARIRLRA